MTIATKKSTGSKRGRSGAFYTLVAEAMNSVAAVLTTPSGRVTTGSAC